LQHIIRGCILNIFFFFHVEVSESRCAFPSVTFLYTQYVLWVSLWNDSYSCKTRQIIRFGSLFMLLLYMTIKVSHLTQLNWTTAGHCSAPHTRHNQITISNRNRYNRQTQQKQQNTTATATQPLQRRRLEKSEQDGIWYLNQQVFPFIK